MSAADDSRPTPIAPPGASDAASDPVPAARPRPSADSDTDMPPSTVAHDPHVSESDTASVNELTPTDEVNSNKWATDAQRLTVIAAIEEGKTPREAALLSSVSIRTVFRILSQADNTVDMMRAAFRKLLQAKALRRLEDWETASQVGALKKGNHAPARDWLLHAGVIDPLDSDTASVKVAIVIGTDDKPMRIPSPLSYLTPPPAQDAGE